LVKKAKEKSQKHNSNEKEIIEVSDSAVLILQYLQHYKKKHNTSFTKKYTFLSTKCASYTTILSKKYFHDKT
jgi:hypothetical protein